MKFGYQKPYSNTNNLIPEYLVVVLLVTAKVYHKVNNTHEYIITVILTGHCSKSQIIMQ